MAIPLEPVSLDEATAIQARFFLGRSSRPNLGTILVVKYDGICRAGNDGETDGRLMLAFGKAGLTAWEPNGLVIDLTGLVCRRLVEGLTSLLYLGEGVFGSENMPQAVVVGPQCEEAVGTFFLDVNAGCKPEAEEEYFHDVESAMKFIEEEMAKLNLKFFSKT